MLANDIPPSRIAAAQDAALSFVADREPGTQIGIVAFAGFAEMVQPPTTDQEALEATILGLSTARRTAIGAGILEALDVIAGMDAASVATDSEPSAPQATPGEYAPHIIVLLTDGVNSTGPEPIEAAQAAAERGIRIYTIGFGTENGGDIPGGGWGGGFRRGIDEATLQRVAEMTGGTYYAAESASELRQVFRELPVYFATRTETQEISVIFTALGALLAAVSVGLSVVWNRLL
jgi:Ca-activated chloride channel homolog